MWELVDRRAAATPRRADADRRRRPARSRSASSGSGPSGSPPACTRLGVGDGHHGDAGSCRRGSRPSSLSMALARLGAVQNPIIHLYREREVGFALRQTGAALFLVPGEWRGFDYAAMARCRRRTGRSRRTSWSTVRPAARGRPATLPPPPAGPATTPVRWIYYTSGTTSDPKGVQHTDQTLIAGGRGLAVALDMSPDDVGSIAFPFAHIAGPDYLVTMLASGFPAVLLEAFVPAEAVAGLPPPRRDDGRREHRLLPGVPGRAAQAARRRRSSRPCGSCPAAARPSRPRSSTRSGGRSGVRVAHGYGMTEVPMICQGSPHDTDDQLANTEGAPVVGADVRIVHADGTGGRAGEEGEVRVKGPMVCKGYTDPRAQRRRVRRRRLLPHRRPRHRPARRARHADRAAQGRDHPQGREHLGQGDRGPALPAPEGRRRGRDRPARPRARRAGVRGRRAWPTGAPAVTFDEMVAVPARTPG